MMADGNFGRMVQIDALHRAAMGGPRLIVPKSKALTFVAIGALELKEPEFHIDGLGSVDVHFNLMTVAARDMNAL